MPGPIYHVGGTAMCPHAGQVMVAGGFPRVLVAGMPVARLTDMTMVVGCPIVPPPLPPCTTVQWLVGAARVFAGGVPVLVQSSQGLGLNPAPAGPVTIIATQPRVVAI